MSTNDSSSDKSGPSTLIKIIVVVVALALAGWAGYAYGYDVSQKDAQAKYDQKVSELQEELNVAKGIAGDEIAEGQENIAEGQQTLESAQAENAQLKNTIAEQNAKITQLEQQLEEANKPTATPTP